MDDDRLDLTALAPSSPAWDGAIDRIAARAADAAAQRRSWAGQIRGIALPALALAAAATAVLWALPARHAEPTPPPLAEQMLDWSTSPALPSVAETLAALEGGR